MRRLAAILLLLSATRCASQSNDARNPDDTLAAYAQIDSLSLYSGRQFIGYPISIDGHAFYGTSELTNGDILYNSVWYHNVHLLYDIYNDQLIVQHPPPFQINIILFKERIPEFTRENDVFVYVRKDPKNVVTSGFYQRLTKGRATVLIRRTKILDEKVSGLQVEQKFVIKDRYYVLKDGTYHSIRRQDDLINLFKDRRQEISQYRSQLNERFKKNPEHYIVAMANYYNQLQEKHED